MNDPAKAWEGLLAPDERILWQGRPVARLAFRPSDLVMSGFGFVFFAFAVFWTYMAGWISRGTDPLGNIFPLFGIPFILVGAYLLFGRFFWDVLRRRGTWYTLTNKRAFIATDVFGHRTLKDYVIEPDANIVLLEEGGEQTVNFAEYWVRGHKGQSHRKTVGFELLPDGREVYGLLREVRDAARDGETV